MDNTDDLEEISRAKLNLETSRIAWRELQRFFAAGSVIAVDPGLDLIEVAYQVALDNKEQVQEWLEQARVAKVPDHQARAWLEADAHLWAVVVRPWILVQADRPT